MFLARRGRCEECLRGLFSGACGKTLVRIRALFRSTHSPHDLVPPHAGHALALHVTGRDVMFDMVTGKARHLPSHASLPIIVSTIAQATVVTALLVIPALFVTDQIPEIPIMIAFVAPPPPPPAPPPPPMQRPVPAQPIQQAR